MIDLYHTSLRPGDCNGITLKPLDLVVINRLPEHYWQDPIFANLSEFSGCYGLITYSSEGAEGVTEYQPYFRGNKEHPGWVSGDGSVVNVLSRRISGESVVSCEFWIPPVDLRKIPFNCLIMNVFAEYPWQMAESAGPSSRFFVKRGMPEYDYIKMILQRPHSTLEAAHKAAMTILERSSGSEGLD